jgi:hypothetical protein
MGTVLTGAQGLCNVASAPARHQVRLHLVDPPHDRRAVGSAVSYGLTLCNQFENRWSGSCLHQTSPPNTGFAIEPARR